MEWPTLDWFRLKWLILSSFPSPLAVSTYSNNYVIKLALPLLLSESYDTPYYTVVDQWLVKLALKTQGTGSTMAYSGAEKVSNDRMTVQGKEGAECALPSLSTLLEDPTINDPDSFVICVQIHCPVGPTLAAQPAVYYVPKDLLDGLEASHDIPWFFLCQATKIEVRNSRCGRQRSRGWRSGSFSVLRLGRPYYIVTKLTPTRK
ncbi:hypothetical protein F5878DRAFT_647218 [Lentinula raphanica]|uniref:Uncharacterized protein n=1 Tax=Lentinula raphanica TaxID=153919 RepID=A0AA38NWI3_9AGAR|nr:hypothetical protein F5878DRAFT_647218 [Lentinula raphanica]